MRIGAVAGKTSVSVETLRYYEQRGLLPAPERSTSGYRTYPADTVRRVQFIRNAQELGFTLDEITELLGFWQDSATSCEQVADRASATLVRIESKIEQLGRMRTALSRYVTACRAREELADCPLLLTLGRSEE